MGGAFLFLRERRRDALRAIQHFKLAKMKGNLQQAYHRAVQPLTVISSSHLDPRLPVWIVTVLFRKKQTIQVLLVQFIHVPYCVFMMINQIC